MSAKKIFCTIFYVIFSLLFTAILICNVTGLLNQLGLVANSFITTTIDANLINPIHTAIDSLGLINSATSLTIVYIFMTVMTIIFWILSVSMLTSILRDSSAHGASIASIILSIVMFAILGLTIVLLVRNGETIANVFANFYLIGQLVIYLFMLLVSILAMSLSNNTPPTQETDTTDQPTPMTAQQREDRINQILDNEIDPRV